MIDPIQNFVLDLFVAECMFNLRNINVQKLPN